MPASRSPTKGCGIFADNALQLRAHGLAVVPTDTSKKPLIAGWNRWKGPPGQKAIDELAEQFPDANLGIIPGLSKLLVADVDTADQAGAVEELLGRTPLRVRSQRGVHLYYRDPDRHMPGNLRAHHFNVDLKRGRSIVIVPPSRHQSGAIYRLDQCDWKALRELPWPNLRWLQNVRPVRAPEAERTRGCIVEGQRGLGLNRVLCRHAAFAEGLDELLDVARSINADFLPPLEETEVVSRTRQVWKDVLSGKIERWAGNKATTRVRTAEIDTLCRMHHRKGPDALALLLVLRNAHGARCKRKETFALVVEAMAETQTIPGWHWKRYREAIRLLLAAGFLVRVFPAYLSRSGRRPARYSLEVS